MLYQIICLVFALVPGMEILNPWNFPGECGIQGGPLRPSDPSWDYANEMIQCSPLDSFTVGAGHAGKTDHAIRGLQLFFFFSFFKRGFEPGVINITSGEGRGAGDEIQSHVQWLNKSCLLNEIPLKLWTPRLNELLRWWVYQWDKKVMCSDSAGEVMELLCLEPSQTSPGEVL